MTAIHPYGIDPPLTVNNDMKPVSNNTFFDKDLHVFIMDPDHLDESVKAFSGLYSLRTRKSREYWLVDISPWNFRYPKGQVMKQIKSDFRGLPLDIDDDLFLFSTNSLTSFFDSDDKSTQSSKYSYITPLNVLLCMKLYVHCKSIKN